MTCPDPRRHLGRDYSFVRRGSSTEVRTDLPGRPPRPGTRRFLATTRHQVLWEEGPGWARVTLSRKPAERWLFMPLGLLGGLAVFLIAAGFAVQAMAGTRGALVREDSAIKRGRIMLEGLVLQAAWSAAMAAGAVLAAAGGKGLAYTREVTVWRESGSALERHLIFGKAWIQPQRYDELIAAAPVPFRKGRHRLYLLFSKDGRPQRRYLLALGTAELPLVSLLNRPRIMGGQTQTGTIGAGPLAQR